MKENLERFEYMSRNEIGGSGQALPKGTWPAKKLRLTTWHKRMDTCYGNWVKQLACENPNTVLRQKVEATKGE